MTKKELIESMEAFGDDDIVVVVGEDGGWDNIQQVVSDGSWIAIQFGGGSPFSDE